MTTLEFTNQPLPVHVPFFLSPAYERLLFGAFGSGKTYAVCDEAIVKCLRYPGIRGLITRKTIPELRDTTETAFFERLPQKLYEAGEATRIGGHYNSFVFPNGSEVLFRGIDDWKKHKSLNLGFIGWDEADEFDLETYLAMLGRLRQREPTPKAAALGAGEIQWRGSFAAANPAGHNWLWQRFVKETAPDRAWFKSTSFDNAYLPIQYLEYLMTYPPAWIKRYVLCQFDDFAGQIYEEWQHDTHVVPRLTEDQRATGNVFWMGMDPGTRDPTAGLWVYLDRPKRRLIAVAEYQENSLSAQVHAAAWKRIEAKHRMHVPWRVADPNAINVRDRGSNMKLSDQYRRLGFNFSLGASHHNVRIPALGQLIHTRQFVTTEDCPQLFDQVQAYQWRDLTPAQRSRGEDAPDKPLKKNSHLVDCGQYVAGRFVRPGPLKVEHADDDWSAEIRAILRRKRLGQARPKRLTLEGVPL